MLVATTAHLAEVSREKLWEEKNDDEGKVQEDKTQKQKGGWKSKDLILIMSWTDTRSNKSLNNVPCHN